MLLFVALYTDTALHMNKYRVLYDFADFKDLHI